MAASARQRNTRRSRRRRQLNPQQSGGVIDLSRNYSGLDARWTARTQIAGMPLEIATGLAYDTLQEQRRGYENYIGSVNAPAAWRAGPAAARRDQRCPRHRSLRAGPHCTCPTAGPSSWARGTAACISIPKTTTSSAATATTSGAASYSQSLPVTALRYAVTKDLNVYVRRAAGGFETPTLTSWPIVRTAAADSISPCSRRSTRAWRSVPRHGLAAAC